MASSQVTVFGGSINRSEPKISLPPSEMNETAYASWQKQVFEVISQVLKEQGLESSSPASLSVGQIESLVSQVKDVIVRNDTFSEQAESSEIAARLPEQGNPDMKEKLAMMEAAQNDPHISSISFKPQQPSTEQTWCLSRTENPPFIEPSGDYQADPEGERPPASYSEEEAIQEGEALILSSKTSHFPGPEVLDREIKKTVLKIFRNLRVDRQTKSVALAFKVDAKQGRVYVCVTPDCKKMGSQIATPSCLNDTSAERGSPEFPQMLRLTPSVDGDERGESPSFLEKIARIGSASIEEEIPDRECAPTPHSSSNREGSCPQR